MGFDQPLPYYENCITLNPKRKNACRIPVPHITCSLFQNEQELLLQQVRSLEEMVVSCGYKVIFSESVLGLENEKDSFRRCRLAQRFMSRYSFKKSKAEDDAIHECGGSAHWNDPAKSVLNSFNQTSDVKNLFVTDGSCFPSSGTVGPTLTIMAVTREPAITSRMNIRPVFFRNGEPRMSQ